MTAGVHLAQYTFHDETGLPKHRVVNNWWFENGGLAEDYDNVRDMLDDFYLLTPGVGVGALITAMSGRLRTGAGMAQITRTVKLYYMGDPSPRVPVYDVTDDKVVDAMQSAQRLPGEVALVVSFEAEPQSGIPQARRRNRIFLGPLNQAASLTGDFESRPAANMIASVRAAGGRLIAAGAAAANWQFIAHSPTYGLSAPVVQGWVDNAWDTQRSRGQDPTFRNQFDAEDDPS